MLSVQGFDGILLSWARYIEENRKRFRGGGPPHAKKAGLR